MRESCKNFVTGLGHIRPAPTLDMRMNPIELIAGTPRADARASASGKAQDKPNTDSHKPNTDGQRNSFSNEIDVFRGGETSETSVSGEVSTGASGAGGGLETLQFHTNPTPMAEGVPADIFDKFRMPSVGDGTEVEGQEQANLLDREKLLELGDMRPEELPTGEVVLDQPSSGALIKEQDLVVGIDNSAIDGLSPENGSSPFGYQAALSGNGEGKVDPKLAVGFGQDLIAAKLPGNDVVDKLLKDRAAIENLSNRTPRTDAGSALLATGTTTQVPAFAEFDRSKLEDVKPNTQLSVDESLRSKDINLDSFKGELVGRRGAEAPAPTPSNVPSLQPALIGPEQVQNMVSDAQIEDIEVIRQVEALASKDRILPQVTTLSGALQFNSAGAKQVMGQVTAGLSQLADGTVEIRLNPVELGRVTIQLIEGVGGIQTANVLAEKPEVLDLLRRNENLLGSEFEQAGMGSMTFSFDHQDRQEGDPDAEPDLVTSLAPQTKKNAISAENQDRTRSDLDIRL